jgi:hypothetical protein
MVGEAIATHAFSTAWFVSAITLFKMYLFFAFHFSLPLQTHFYTKSHSLANFVGIVVGFLNVFSYTLAEPPPCRLVIF